MENFNMKEFQDQLKEKFEKEKENEKKEALLTEQARKQIGDIQFEEPRDDYDYRAPVKTRGDIAFEPPRDDDERILIRGDIRFEDPVEPTIEARLEQLERGQDKILMMLQMLLDRDSKDMD